MAVGDVFAGMSSVSPGGGLDIRPPSGTEAVIHNIYHESNATLLLTDGTNSFAFDSETGSGVWARFNFHVTYGLWIRVRNDDSVNYRLIAYDGIQTK